ncbi:4-hydroxy-tetrahydrodipicolinate reductase [Synergistaceae bacterium OttesenSCG-928-I11]|nr:4-hydroxy-tetrahydrodipicolinate reductase [Synergistaceae bacterium OttesenSCG-928-I11]
MRYGLIGYSGRMGREIEAAFAGAGHELVLRVDGSGEECSARPEVIVDFSAPDALPTTLRLCAEHNAALVMGSTGFSEADLSELRALGEERAVVHSSNFSVGINLLGMILEDYAGLFSKWEMEIVEVHHNQKKDAPSGTALMLMQAAGRDCPIHALRLGNVPGDHTVHYCLDDEVVSLSHHAVKRSIYAAGACTAAEFARSAPNGYYTFRDVLRLSK